MAIDTTQPEQLNMLLVMKSYDRTLFVWRGVDLCFGSFDLRVREPHDIRSVRSRRQFLSLGGKVADNALSVMAPFAVTAKALTMICSLQSRLAEIGFIAVRLVALFARRDLPRRTEVVAGAAVVSHLRHAGMQLMVKIHRLIKIGDLI